MVGSNPQSTKSSVCSDVKHLFLGGRIPLFEAKYFFYKKYPQLYGRNPPPPFF